MENKEYSKEELLKLILDSKGNLKLNELEENLIHELVSGKVAINVNKVHNENTTFGQRTADNIAKFGGSWAFIITFLCILISWIFINAVVLLNKAFDPYPFVFLNLILSCLAAIQAPIIMMSQNRQAEKDRITAENDYLVNFKSEIMIEDLHYKLDKLVDNQQMWDDVIKRLKIIEENQIKIIEISKNIEKNND